MSLFSTFLLGGASFLAFASIAYAEDTVSANRFVQHNFVANKAIYKADTVDEKMINAWGIAIRPAGEGGHFWVGGKDTSFQYVGDVQNSPTESLRVLHADDIPHIGIPVGGDEQMITGLVFSDSRDAFVITQKPIEDAPEITAPAKFLFASDGGVISAWTERKKEDGTFERALQALSAIDNSAKGAQYFGITLNAHYNRLYAANFGAVPGMEVFDGQFKPVDVTFDRPFDDNKNDKVDPGEYAPFNVQSLKTQAGGHTIFVSYAKTQSCPAEEVAKDTCKDGELFIGEEDTAKPGQGRVAEFTEDGKLVSVWQDGGKLSAPWGMVFAPADYGPLSNNLLVANFGDGTIAAYDPKTHAFNDYMRDEKGEPVKIDKIWGLLFGNGQSLGDTRALYFTAGPEDEVDGLFGSLRAAK
ncbi:MAG: TIGR03118 family protein [Alphaproteobacteria bacterium]